MISIKNSKGNVDRVFLSIVVVLIAAGFFIFISSSLGLLARDGARLGAIAFNQLVFGVLVGAGLCFGAAKIQYRSWRRYSLFIFLGSLIFTSLVFVPGLGLEHGGAKRWINIGFTTIQPAELLKIAFIIYFATWLGGARSRLAEIKYGLLPLFIFLSIIGGILLLQPDTDTFLVIVVSALAMFITAGGKWRDVIILTFIGLIALAALAFFRPYIGERISIFLNPALDPLGAGYQIQQSLIAIGSGGLTGRGFGQSIQKFNYLPEPVGDSIFAVAAEEFGFMGSVLLIAIFVAFAIRGFHIAARAPDAFGASLTVGLVVIITTAAFMNIASMLGLIPLSGLPLPFVSHGGTALLTTLFASGIILSVSRKKQA